MANPYHGNVKNPGDPGSGKGPNPGGNPTVHDSMPKGVTKYPSAGGPKQSGNRTAGVKSIKGKVYVQSEGLC